MERDYNIRKKDGTLTTRLVCAVLFLVFTFAWLFFFQADLLAVAQHGLSGGKTHYDRTVGAVITTAVLFLLQLLVYAVVKLARRTHALTYLPSFLMLAFVSSLSSPFRWGAWAWAAPLLLLLWGGAVWLAKRMLPFSNDDKEPTGLFSQRLWLNLLQMAAMMMGVVAASDTSAVSHFKAHAEVALQNGDADEALRVGQRSHESDVSLTMLRVFALSQKGELGSRLFEYPVVGTSADMLPLPGSKSRLLLLADTVLWDHFALQPDSFSLRPDSLALQAHASAASDICRPRLTTRQYIDSLQHYDSLATPAWRDYRLCGMLIDRRIDDFAAALPAFYPLSPDSLPRHYREALIIYQQQRDTSYIYSDTAMLARWHSFLRYDSLYPRKTERLIRAEEEFLRTYWYYYFR